jgi:hypothetical protein
MPRTFDEMSPDMRERQVERRVPKSEVMVSWVILIGVAALVVLGFAVSIFAH